MSPTEYDLGKEVEKFLADIEDGTRDQIFGSTMLKAMGCPHIIRTRGASRLVLPEKGQDLAALQGHIYRLITEPNILAYSGNGLSSLLAGLNRYGGLDRLLQTEENNYRLAYMLVYWIEWRSCELDDAVEADLEKIVKDWLKVDPAIDTLEDPKEICQSLFGAAWCELVLPELGTGKIGEYIYDARPQFAPGICLAQPMFNSIDLPHLA